MAIEVKEELAGLVAVRVAPVNYMAVLLLASFFAAFLIYIEQNLYALLLFVGAWVAVPLLAYSDRVVFDGRRLRRTGLVPRLWAYLTSTRDRMRLKDVEQVESYTVRSIKRGRNVIYTYRTVFFGKGVAFAVHSGSRDYRRMIGAVLPSLNESLLDNRSIEIRDHGLDRGEIRKKARAADIPPADILEGSLKEIRASKQHSDAGRAVEFSPGNTEKAESLRRLGNELRISGYLPQAVEAFRRALLLMPRNANLLFDFARCLQSFAGSERDNAMERKALALMRLAERRAFDDGDLLIRIGESYFQFGDWRRAAAVFKKAVGRFGEKFRSVLGLAEIAHREGKIAHVIHNFAAANSLAETTALRRWTRNEIEYFSRLNCDDEYMELEVSRMNLLESLETAKKTALRIALAGFPVIIAGIVLDDALIANIGWALSIVSLAVWALLILLKNILSARIPFNLIEDE